MKPGLRPCGLAPRYASCLIFKLHFCIKRIPWCLILWHNNFFIISLIVSPNLIETYKQDPAVIRATTFLRNFNIFILRAPIVNRMVSHRFFTSSVVSKTIVGVNAFVIRDDKILLGRRLNSIDAGTWGAPGGHIELGETPFQAARREVLEETGLQYRGFKLLGSVNGQFSERELPYHSYFVLGTLGAGEPKVCEPNKCEGWRWFKIDNLPKPLFGPIRNLLEQNPDVLADVAHQFKDKSLFLASGKAAKFSIFTSRQVSSQEKIKVLSFDADLCLFNAIYLKILQDAISNMPNMSWGAFLQVQEQALHLANQELFLDIAKNASESACSKIQLMLGSARQSHQDDWINRLTGPTLTGSAHQALLMVKRQFEDQLLSLGHNIRVEVLYLLLADLYANLAHGAAFKLALEQMHKDFATWSPGKVKQLTPASFKAHPNWIFDDSKLTIIYAQIHHIAIANPYAMLEYAFYDDRLDILENLARSLTPKLIPLGLTMMLNQYAEGKVKCIAVIKGEGLIDYQYSESIKQMIKLSGITDNSKIVNIISCLNQEGRMSHFLEWRENRAFSEAEHHSTSPTIS